MKPSTLFRASETENTIGSPSVTDCDRPTLYQGHETVQEADPTPNTQPLPAGVEPRPLDAALLVASLREVYRVVKRREAISDSPEVLMLCRELRHLVEQEIQTVGDRKAAWEALKSDLLSAFRVEVIGVSDSPWPKP